MLTRLATLLKTLLSATRQPALPDDHTWSQSSMAAQRAKGEAEAPEPEAAPSAVSEPAACNQLQQNRI
jgi:hypothetical protein